MYKWNYRYMYITKEIANWSSCLRRKVGSIITVNRRIVATGYNGAPSGIDSCKERGYCLREKVQSGEKLEECLAVHAEQNAIAQAAKMGISIDNGEIYVTTFPCVNCMKQIIASGIRTVYYLEDYNSPLAKELAKKANISVIKMEDQDEDQKI